MWQANGCHEEDSYECLQGNRARRDEHPSWEDAAAQAVKTASESLHDLRVAEVVKQDIHLDDGAITFRTKLQLSFKYEQEG